MSSLSIFLLFMSLHFRCILSHIKLNSCKYDLRHNILKMYYILTPRYRDTQNADQYSDAVKIIVD